MIERIQKIQQEVEAYVFDENQKAESFRLAYLSKKGLITTLFDEFKSCSVEEKKSVGSVLNQLKRLAEEKYQTQKEVEETQQEVQGSGEDRSLPVYQFPEGSLHPLRIVEDRLLEIFYSYKKTLYGFNL